MITYASLLQMEILSCFFRIETKEDIIKETDSDMLVDLWYRKYKHYCMNKIKLDTGDWKRDVHWNQSMDWDRFFVGAKYVHIKKWILCGDIIDRTDKMTDKHPWS